MQTQHAAVSEVMGVVRLKRQDAEMHEVKTLEKIVQIQHAVVYKVLSLNMIESVTQQYDACFEKTQRSYTY
jgi:hypothetical protein